NPAGRAFGCLTPKRRIPCNWLRPNRYSAALSQFGLVREWRTTTSLSAYRSDLGTTRQGSRMPTGCKRATTPGLTTYAPNSRCPGRQKTCRRLPRFVSGYGEPGQAWTLHGWLSSLSHGYCERILHGFRALGEDRDLANTVLAVRHSARIRMTRCRRCR